jgi:bifunctional non-homologous end joining protein LigD
MPRPFHPMPLQSRRLPFDDPDWIFELKYDGFRALAEIRERALKIVLMVVGLIPMAARERAAR